MKSRRYDITADVAQILTTIFFFTLVKLALFICGLSIVTRSVDSTTTIHALLTLTLRLPD